MDLALRNNPAAGGKNRVAEDTSHQTISSWFIGPQAENIDAFQENINYILKSLADTRKSYFKDDKSFITDSIKKTPAFQSSSRKLSAAVHKTADLLGKHSIPFWSPRYEAHMCTDNTMASLLGYFMTMLYNPNNVALEASPLSTVAEIEVGEQLCELFGYNIDEDDTQFPTGWAHVCADGTIANIESIWSARNLKFYPFSLKRTMEKGKPLEHLAGRFRVELCCPDEEKGGVTEKPLMDCTDWELLNLKPDTILDMPDRLCQEFGISHDFLSKVINEYTIQSTGKDELEKYYDLKPSKYFISNTRHYSWPKGAAICGIGSENVVGVDVDDAARIDIDKLEKKLRACIKDKQPVFAVVAIIGSTEEGAVDSLSSILALRKQLQAEGLSFLVHADAAWGGYFATMLPRDWRPGDVTNPPTEMGKGSGFVPDASLRTETQDDLYALRFADSITVDPHKAGYIPYPAGGLCYRDGRMRFLVTWTSPYLSRGSVTSIGIYGLEGSKPGASAMSAWLSNKTLGLTPDGYGQLLSEATWSCTRFSAEWAAMSITQDYFLCVPFNKLPTERVDEPSKTKVNAQKKLIWREIVQKSNEDIMKDAHEREGEDILGLMRELGSDLNINCFALNFRYENGLVNDDIEEANYLMARVIERLSVDNPDDDTTSIPLYLTSTVFEDELYGDCKKHFMERLELAPSKQGLMVLRNVVMSPFPSDGNFINSLANYFRDVVTEETLVVRQRNQYTEDLYSFLVQGTEDIFLVHLPLFHEANHRQQLIVSVDFDEKAKTKYRALKKCNSTEPMILVTQQKILLKDLMSATKKRGGSSSSNTETETTFEGQIMTKESGIILKDIKVKLKKTVVSRPLNSKYRADEYPEKCMPFYLYGSGEQANIDHVLTRAPNTQLSAGRCTLEFESSTEAGDLLKQDPEAFWKKNYVLIMRDVHETTMQPFPKNEDIGSVHGAIVPNVNNPNNGGVAAGNDGGDNDTGIARVVTSQTRRGQMRGSPGFFFRPNATFRVKVYEDTERLNDKFDLDVFQRASIDLEDKESELFVGEGTIKLGEGVYVDSEGMNYDKHRPKSKVDDWRREFDSIGRELND